MLVLSRRVDERIWIGEDICIDVRRIDHNLVRIGIIAPEDKKILREEIKPNFECIKCKRLYDREYLVELKPSPICRWCVALVK